MKKEEVKMRYNNYNWSADFMLSEILGLDYEEVENDTVVGLYSLKDFPEVNMYIDMENNKVIEVFLIGDDE